MNKNRMLIGGAVAILIGLLASQYVYKQVQQAKARPIELSQIVVAAQDMRLGTRLQPDMLRTIPWPSNERLQGSFANIKDCLNRALITPVSENEPILADKLAPTEAGAGLPAAIPEGMRAVSVRVDDVVAVAGFVMPETMVDVLVTGSPQGNNAESVTRTILENIRVLAAGQKVEQDKDGKPMTVNVVTLLVNPEQADELTMASTEGRIHLALRNTIDTAQTDPPPVFKTALLLGARPAAPVATGRRVTRDPKPVVAPNPAYSVEIIRGSKRETEKLSGSETGGQ